MTTFLSRRRGAVIAFIVGLLLASASTATAARLITGKDIKNGSIAEKDLAKPVRTKLNAPGPAGPRGEQGPKGETGPRGEPGTPGPSWVTAGSAGLNSTGIIPDLAGYTESGFPQGFTTTDAGPVTAASSVRIAFDCTGPGSGLCSLNWALAIDGVPLRGSSFGRSLGGGQSATQDLTLFGTLAHLPAGTHDLRVYTKTTAQGGVTPSVQVTSWSFTVQRVGAVG